MRNNMSLSDRMKYAVGGDRLGHNYDAFLLVHGSFLISTRLPGVFINTLLLGESNELGVVMLYNMAFFLSGAVSMVVAAQVLHKTNSGVVAVTGVMGYNALYLALIVLILSGQTVSEYYLILGVLTGVADGFYWLSYGNLLSDTTELQNRDSGMAIVSICTSVINLCIPLLSGWIISTVGSISGYLVVFAMAFAVSVVTSLLALRMPKSRHTGGDRVDYRATLRAVNSNKRLHFALLAQGCKGIREGVFTFILSIVLYQLISSEFIIGVNTFVAALVSIVSYTLMSRVITRKNRVGLMTLATAALCAAAAVCLFRLDIFMIFVFTVVNSFFAGFIENSCYANFLDMLQKTHAADAHRPEMFALNETCLVLGRSIGIVIILVMSAVLDSSLHTQIISLVVLSFTQFITVCLCRLSEKYDKKEEMENAK